MRSREAVDVSGDDREGDSTIPTNATHVVPVGGRDSCVAGIVGRLRIVADTADIARAVDSGGVAGATTRIRIAVAVIVAASPFCRAPQLCHKDRARGCLIEFR